MCSDVALVCYLSASFPRDALSLNHEILLTPPRSRPRPLSLLFVLFVFLNSLTTLPLVLHNFCCSLTMRFTCTASPGSLHPQLNSPRPSLQPVVSLLKRSSHNSPLCSQRRPEDLVHGARHRSPELCFSHIAVSCRKQKISTVIFLA